MAPPRLRTLILAAYGAPALPLAALTLPVYIFLPTFYAETLGLGLASVGLALLMARLWDVVTDPLVGYLSDRTRTAIGRRRPWVIAGAPLVLTAVWFLLVPGEGVGLAYLLGWSLALYLGWTMMILPLSAWGAELSPDYNERSRIAAFREGFILTGALCALGLPAVLGYAGSAEIGSALEAIALFVVVLLPPAMVALLALTPEPKPTAWHSRGLRGGWAVIRDNRPFRRLISAYLLNGVANGLPATLFLLFVDHVLERPEQAGLLLAVYFASGVVAIPLWLRLSYRYGKHKVWCGAMIWACANFIWVPLLGPGDLPWFIAICVLTGVALGADLVLPSSMQADVVDLDTVESGQQRTGLFFAMWGMVTKLALAVAVGLAFPILDAVGFEEGGEKDATSLLALAMLYGLLPVILKAAAIVLMWEYPITAARQVEIRHLLDRQRSSDEDLR